MAAASTTEIPIPIPRPRPIFRFLFVEVGNGSAGTWVGAGIVGLDAGEVGGAGTGFRSAVGGAVTVAECQ